MDTRKIQEQIADLYEYNRLPKDKSDYYRKLYLDNIPIDIFMAYSYDIQNNTALKTKNKRRWILGNEMFKMWKRLDTVKGKEF
jgi:hypothetical protein